MPKIELIRAKKPDMPKWLIQLYGPSGGGKTLLASKLPGSKLVFDADGDRFMDQADENDEIYFAYKTTAENRSIANITAAIDQTIPDSDIANIVIDTMTIPFQILIEEVKRMTGKENRTHKSEVMKALRRALSGYNRNILIIFHTHIHGDKDFVKGEAKTLSDIELGRFDMITNMTLKIVIDPKTNKRGVLIERNRFGHAGITVWDETGKWDGFWEKLQTEAYKGLTRADMDKIASSTPTLFADRAAAWAWGMEQGCFNDITHAKNAMAEIENASEVTADELWPMWVAEVQRRVSEKKALLATVAGAVDALYTGKLKAPNRKSFAEWMIARYTTARTPDNVRYADSELTAQETATVVAALNERSDFYLDEFSKRPDWKAAQPVKEKVPA